MTPNPQFHFNAEPTGDDASVAASSVVTATITDLDGVRQVEWYLAGTDETSSPDDYVLALSGPRNSVCTFTALGDGTAGALTCRLNGGIDQVTGQTNPLLWTTQKFYVPTTLGLVVRAEAEDDSATAREVAVINAVVRVTDAGSGGGGGGASGTTTLAALRAVAAGARTDREQFYVDAEAATFVWKAAQGASVADDGLNVILPGDLLVGASGRFYRDPQVVTTATPGVQPAADKVRVNRLQAQQLATEVALTNADSTLTLAGGQRYVLHDGTLATQPRVKTLSNTGAVAGDKMYFRSEQRGSISVEGHHAAVIVNAAGSVILSVLGPGLYVAEHDGTHWRGATPAGMALFNVKDYGAVGDERITVSGAGSVTAERAAIQQAVDAAAAACRDNQRNGACVYFPPGSYRIDGGPIVMKRTPYGSPITFLGAGGGRVSTIANAIGVGPLGDAFRVESMAENPDNTVGGEQWSFVDLAIYGKHYGVIWDLGDAAVPGTDDGTRPSPRFERCFFSRTNSPGPCVRFRLCSRATFNNCVFDVLNFINGTIGLEIVRGSFGMIRCRGGGGLVRARDSGEITMLGCRAEGGRGVPAWDFLKCINILIAHSSNEGHEERDSLYRFQSCQSVTLDNAFPATADQSYVQTFGTVPISGAPTLTVTHAAETSLLAAEDRITRSTGSWFEDLIGNGSKIKITNAVTNTGWLEVLEATHDILWVKQTVAPETVVAATGVGTQYKLDNSLQPTLTFNAGAQTITRGGSGPGSWVEDGFVAGMVFTTTAPLNPGPFTVSAGTAPTDTVLTVVSGVVNEGPLTGRRVFGSKRPAGITFRNTWGFQVRNAISTARFGDQGDGTRLGVEVDADCRDGRIEYSMPGATSDITIDPDAYNVTGECHGHSQTPAVRRSWWHGTQRVHDLDIQNGGILPQRTDEPTVPAAMTGWSIRRGPLDEQSAVGLYWDEAGACFRAGFTDDELSVDSLVDLHADRFVGPANDAARVVVRNGQAFAVDYSTSTIGDTNLFSVNSVGGTIFTAGARFLKFVTTSATGIEITAPVVNIAGTGAFGVWISYAGAVLLEANGAGLVLRKVVPLGSVDAGAGIITDQDGRSRRGIHKRSFSFAAFSADASTGKLFRFVDLPAKMKVVGVVCDTTIPFQGGAISAASLQVGTEDDPDAYILAHDVFTVGVVKGLADADLGVELARATAVQGGHVPSWTATKALRVQLDVTGANLTALTQGAFQVTVIVENLG